MKLTFPSVQLSRALLLGIVISTQAAGLELEIHVVAGGGGSSRTERFHVDGTIGQAVAESEASLTATKALRAGFWSEGVRWLSALPAAAEDVIERRAGEAAHVLIRTLLGNDSATDLEDLEFVAVDPVSAAGGSVLRDGPWIIYQPPAAAPDIAEDSFGYRVRDALGVTTTGTVRVRIAAIPGGGPPNALQVETVAGDPPLVRVRFEGVTGRSYEVQTALDLLGPWTTSATRAAGADGTILFTEPVATGSLFFRIIEPPAP